MNDRSSGEPPMCAWVEMGPGVRTPSGASIVSLTASAGAATPVEGDDVTGVDGGAARHGRSPFSERSSRGSPCLDTPLAA
jgi:hypothetical protein